MKLVDASVDYPHAVIVTTLLCVIFGGLAIFKLPLQLKPTVDRPEIQITTAYRGTSPLEVEEQITIPVEDQMESVSGITKITSESAEGRSVVKLEFDWGVNKDSALVDVINKLTQIPDLPDEADEPVVESITSDQQEAIMWIILGSKTQSTNELYDYTKEVIEPQIRRVDGVSDLMVFGGEEREMQILINPEQLAARGISIETLISAIQRENMNVRGGFMEQGKRRYTLRTVGRLRTPADVGEIIVARNAGGAVFLRELATAEVGYKPSLSFVRTNGQPTVAIGVRRKAGSNTVDISKAVKARIAQFNEEFKAKSQDMELALAYTDETYINESIVQAAKNILYGAVLASIVLLIFLRSWRSLLVAAIAIPTCIITVFIFLQAAGRSLNIISLAGLAFSSGMIVDNAIVVIENIYRHIGMGKKPLDAAKIAATEVWGAVTASTLTTLAVFLPIIFIEEEAGQLFKDIAIAISLSISLSLIVAITLIPMMAGRLMTPPAGETKDGGLIKVWHRFTYWIGLVWLGELFYAGYDWILDHIVRPGAVRTLVKVVFLGAIVGLFVWSLKLLPPAEYLPSGNRNLILVINKPIVGSNLDKIRDNMAPFEAALLERMKVHPQMQEDGSVTMEKGGDVERFFVVGGDRFNAVGIIVDPAHAQEQNMQNLLYGPGGFGAMAGGLRGFEFVVPIQASIFRDPGKQLEIDLIGPDLDRLAGVMGQMMGQLFGLKGVVTYVRPNYQTGSPEVQVKVDRKLAATSQIRVSEVADMVQSMVAGKYVGTYTEKGRQLDLTVYSKTGTDTTIEDLKRTYLWSPVGKPVQLDSIASIDTTTGPTAINHVEKERSITLTVNLTPDIPLEEAQRIIESQILNPMRQQLPAAYTLRLGGTADKLNTTLAALTSSFYLAVFIVYLLMVALFKSWSYPFIILFTIPLAMSGAFLGIKFGHWYTDGLVSFDVIAMLGLIILAGIVVNNAILIVHQTLNNRAEGMGPQEALRESCRTRLRPIFMSVATSVLGMLPMAVGHGAGSELYRGLGYVILGGLIISTLFTLFVVPAVMSLMEDVKLMWAGLFTRGTDPAPAGAGSATATPAADSAADPAKD